jgi:hypothetical protein
MFLESSSQHFLYADDIAMLYHGSSKEDLKEMMEHDFKTTSTWAFSNKLSINNDKTIDNTTQHYFFRELNSTFFHRL